MASVESLIRAALLTMDTVTALVGGTGNSAIIRADNLTENDKLSATVSAIIIEVDTEDHQPDLSGIGRRIWCDVNLVCRGVTRTTSRALAEAVRLNGTDPGTGLAGYSGTVLSTVLDAWLEDIVLTATPRGDGSDRYWYDTNMSFGCTAAVVF